VRVYRDHMYGAAERTEGHQLRIERWAGSAHNDESGVECELGVDHIRDGRKDAYGFPPPQEFSALADHPNK
jgi:hypothetical protein